MIKSVPRIEPGNEDLGPLDEHGQQIWTPQEAAAIARMHADPDYWSGIAEAEADERAGRMSSTEEVFERLAERQRVWRAERGV